MRLLSLLKAVLSQDMNMFKYSAGKNASKFKKIVLPIFLFIIVSASIGYYAYAIAEILAPLHLTFIMLSMFIAVVTILTFIEGIYKSQGILFEAKDNDMLFSLPIKKSTILFVRIFKLILFEYIYNLMFILPAFAIYIYFENPGVGFYLISLLMTLLIPIIPTVISCFIGYIVKMISSKFKAKKIAQTVLSCIVFIGIFLVSFNLNSFMENIASNATNLNEMLIKIYYPIGAYTSLINQFDILIFVKLLAINIIPFSIFIILGQKYYFKIISNFKSSSINTKNNKKNTIKIRKPIFSLAIKEIKRYLSSTVYMFNSSMGLVIALVLTIILCLKGKEMLVSLLSGYGMTNAISIELLFYGLILFTGAFTSITSSSISLEGRTINITKTLPISYKTILNSKILYCFIIELPFFLISELIFIFRFGMSLTYLIQIIALTFVLILISAVIGLLVNLKYPKLNASNDTEVVKQSMSSTISVFIGFGIFILSIFALGYLGQYIDINILISLHILLLAIIAGVLYTVLMRIGPKEYQKLNI